MMFKIGQKVVLSEHDLESRMNIEVGAAGEVLDSKPNLHGWIYCYWPDARIKRWWVDPECLKAARPISLENK